jgi:hypothetical protein
VTLYKWSTGFPIFPGITGEMMGKIDLENDIRYDKSV